MDPEEELLQLHPLSDKNPSLYKLLLTSLEASHYAAFKSLINKALKKHPHGVQVDHFFSHPYDKTFLDIASSKGLKDFVELLLELGANPNRINESRNRAPLHFAVENSHSEVVKILLEDPAINPNLEAGRQTALHIAIKNKDRNCTEMLLQGGASPNIPNSKGISALHQAATTNQREIVRLILEKSKVPVDLDSYEDLRKQTTRQILQNKFPDLILSEIQQRRVGKNQLRYYLDANDEKNFLENLEKVEPNVSINTEELIIEAASRNLFKAVAKLISREEVVEISKAGEIAVQRGHYEVLQKLLNYDCHLGKKLIILGCQELATPCRRSLDHRDVRLMCLKLILSQKNVDVRVEDEKGNTPLHYAARAEHSAAVDLLLQAGSYIGHRNRLGMPPLAHICPASLSDYFDNCIKSSNPRSDDYEIHFDYHCLMPHAPTYEIEEPLLGTKKRNQTKADTEMLALLYIAENKALKHLLKHPLLASFLYIKWSRIRHILYANLLFYLVFYIFLNCYIIFANSKNETERKEVFTAEEGIFWTVTIAAIIILAVREFFQCLSSPGYYITSLENWLEVALVILAAVFLFTSNAQVGTILILLSAWELVVLIGQHPKMSTGIEIFKTVSVNFIKFLFLYAFLILSFALAFYTLFKNGDEENKPFPSAPKSIFKTIVMLTGEFEASNIPFVMYPVLGHIIFVLFEFLIAIVLFNLLTGLAVSDTQEILAEAELVSLISRTKMISYAEGVAVGVQFFPENGGYCCVQPILQIPKLNPLAFVARRILIFPNYLPEGKVSVKPYKNHEILLQGHGSFKSRRFDTLKLDASITENAKKILSQRGRVPMEEKVISELNSVSKRLEKIESILLSLPKFSQGNNNIDVIDYDDNIEDR
ncbi:transient receptor potential cation channel protein painless-like [Belonocnema kinseyi]|uniref:transient receptor potential cation channel protein painless-like n=1 Tax=Belonocnema kinseyi TaxID=2817044 RepID=UPI00143DE0ED|nr:transient receptor potential cation channel protein painless-like [Belonocnema kinseyi]XP_033216475.1 transient receptor potential cation channel protein painless-like [Belonocnema kinseyi]XP_033216476.1 transient receptor potential cation channel protein painless-like [Belonocnema kinseyi]XP_033216477.1 transient receptor potential cation channel protein painless-like [Belonocnema kinseyi]XP_033216478.1 transient receptor potential cation channel protein painless-like [Belonocnema kinseyi]